MKPRSLLVPTLLLLALTAFAQDKPLYWAISNNDALAAWNLTDPSQAASTIPGPSDLVLAVARGSGEVVDVLSYRGAPLDAIDEAGRNLLYEASVQGRLDLFRKIAAAGARLEQIDREGWGLVHAGAQSVHAEMTPYLLKRGLPASQRSGLGVTPLMLACATGLSDNVVQLLAWGANPWDEDFLGRDVLWYAKSGGNREVLSLLELETLVLPEPAPNDTAPLP